MVKNNLNLRFVLDLLNLGKRPSEICKEYNIKKQSINYYLKTLKANGNIKKIGYGTWEVKNITLNTPTKQVQIRGHAFIWKIRISKDINWSKFNLTKLKNVYQIIINNKKVWLSKRKVTIYENKDFNGNDAIQSRKLAVIEMVKDLDTLKKTLNVNFNYGFEVSREHYSMVKNELADYYNSRKEKMVIKDDLNKEWLWIDFSDGIDELETNKLTNSKQVQNWWNDNKKYNFTVTPSFLMESLSKLTSIQIETNNQLLEYREQNKVHLELINLYKQEAEERLKIKKKKTYLKESQSTLNNF